MAWMPLILCVGWTPAIADDRAFPSTLATVWPALGEAAHRGDREWVQRVTKQTLAMVLGVWVVGATGIWFLGSFFIHLWTGSADFANSDLIAAACAQSLGLGLFTWLSILLSALSQQRLLVVTSVLASLVFLPLAIFLGGRFGPVGVALAQVVSPLFCAVPLEDWCLIKLAHPHPKTGAITAIRN